MNHFIVLLIICIVIAACSIQGQKEKMIVVKDMFHLRYSGVFDSRPERDGVVVKDKIHLRQYLSTLPCLGMDFFPNLFLKSPIINPVGRNLDVEF